MEKIIKFHELKNIGVVFLAKETISIYGGFYSVWLGTDCVDFGLCLDSASELYNEFLNRY